MRPLLSSLIAALALAGCYTSTHRAEGDGDADGDADSDLPRCAEPAACDALGFEVGYDFVLTGEVVSVASDRVVVEGEDGVPATFHTCGLDPVGQLAAGDTVVISHRERAGGGDGCWESQLGDSDGPELYALDCPGERAAIPAFTARLSLDLEPACEGFTDHVCFPGRDPIHLDVPETVFDLIVSVPGSSEARVAVGEVGAVGPWRFHLLDARSAERTERPRCTAPATGRTALVAMLTTETLACPEPPDVDRTTLGFAYMSASEFASELVVVGLEPETVTLATEDGDEVPYGWYGPDPSLALELGQPVMARRYDWDVTGSGFLDVLEVDGEARLAVNFRDGFTLELPDLSVIGVTMELGDPCSFQQGASECTGEPLIARTYPVHLFYEGSNVAVAQVGQTVEAGPYRATLLEASQYPGMFCPDIHVEAWGPFGVTLLRP